MPVQIEPKHLRDVLFYEAVNGYSRSTLAMKEFELGAVINAAGEMIKLEGSEGEKKAVGVAVNKSTVIDLHAIVLRSGLVFPEGSKTEQKNTAIKDLRALGIKVR